MSLFSPAIYHFFPLPGQNLTLFRIFIILIGSLFFVLIVLFYLIIFVLFSLLFSQANLIDILGNFSLLLSSHSFFCVCFLVPPFHSHSACRHSFDRGRTTGIRSICRDLSTPIVFYPLCNESVGLIVCFSEACWDQEFLEFLGPHLRLSSSDPSLQPHNIAPGF